MHPKEFKHIKNNTGRLTHLSLKNSELFVGVDFTCHKKLNSILNDKNNSCYVLFPSKKSISLNEQKLESKKRLVILIIDATWDSAKPILRLSKNMHKLPFISFAHTKTSGYKFKKQPFKEALSTMESTLTLLEILNEQKVESLLDKELKSFIEPFKKMVKFQMKYAAVKPRFRKL
jgi:DTW domain-containing protein YfiP